MFSFMPANSRPQPCKSTAECLPVNKQTKGSLSVRRDKDSHLADAGTLRLSQKSRERRGSTPSGFVKTDLFSLIKVLSLSPAALNKFLTFTDSPCIFGQYLV